MTNAMRQELHPQGTIVSGLHVGYMDTDMTVGVKGPKDNPAVVARVALDGIEAGEFEILADEVRRWCARVLRGESPPFTRR
jgi:NAD(P)-dependent dehydrogenase (short-subunit alcohol dehydrogenase family)